MICDAAFELAEVFEKGILPALFEDCSDETLQGRFVRFIGLGPARMNHGLACGLDGIGLQSFDQRGHAGVVLRPHAKQGLIEENLFVPIGNRMI